MYIYNKYKLPREVLELNNFSNNLNLARILDFI